MSSVSLRSAKDVWINLTVLNHVSRFCRISLCHSHLHHFSRQPGSLRALVCPYSEGTVQHEFLERRLHRHSPQYHLEPSSFAAHTAGHESEPFALIAFTDLHIPFIGILRFWKIHMASISANGCTIITKIFNNKDIHAFLIILTFTKYLKKYFRLVECTFM